MLAERGKAIDAALSQLEKQFGKGSIMRLGSEGSDRADCGDFDGVDLV